MDAQKTCVMNHRVLLSRCFGKPLVKRPIKHSVVRKIKLGIYARVAYAVKVAYLQKLGDLPNL